ncbi:MAG TPA: DNA polymerase III subunit gamma/tau, partial [Acidobacteriaceae bacterium]|nr:DNA polymerase III subunit gamma/tau [Acidobacteriaceae bacterium]
ASALNCRTEIGAEKRPTPEPCNACESCLEIRQGNAVDVIEIDAATNRGIDEIRELRDAARYSPARDKYKIIILDEAHQITDAAFNALLKTLEEPPEHIVFMMATTQPEDIPQTIRSRCQHFSFHAVKLDDIIGQLRSIATAENISADDATLALLAEAGDGSMRDALSIMDQAIASAPTAPSTPEDPAGRPVLQADEVRELMGSVSNAVFEQILSAVHANNSADVLAILGRLLDAGNGPQPLARQFVRFLRNCTVAKITHLHPDEPAHGLAADLLQISPEERSRAARSASLFTEEELSRFLSILLRTFDDLGYRQEPRFHLELGVLKLVHLQRLLPVEDLLTQLGATKSAPTPLTTPASLPAPAASSTRSPATPPAPTASSPGRLGTPAATSPHGAPAASPASSRPPLASPFETDRTRKTPVASTSVTPPREAPPAPATVPGAPSSPPVSSSAKLGSADAPSPETTPSTSSSPAASITTALPSATVDPTTASAPPIAAPPPAVLFPERPQHFAPSATPVAAIPSTDGALALAPELPPPPPAAQPASTTAHDLAALQSALIAALDTVKGQQTASDAIHDATLTLAGDTLQIQTTLSKAMLPMAINTEADRLLKAALRDAAPSLKLALLPGVPAAKGAKKSNRPAPSGSASELAENHPIVQQAKRLFSAEISSVIDLRDKD